ncbi:hypothetical protein Acsp05_62270 [Actinokineospora sp. NBRC 105648]|nr:hypothetical protein Acsp05_62270 [Actinokineospora sp. NBRC 105648]
MVLGGDCSLLLGPGLVAHESDRRIGLVYLDGSSDLRHPGNSDTVGAAAGEVLAHVTGRGQIGGRYFADSDVTVLGIRDYDDYLAEMTEAGIAFRTAPDIRGHGAAETAAWVLGRHGAFWLHLDVDVLDPSVLSAVDSPDPGGLSAREFVELVTPLAGHPSCVGLDLAIYDPDLDQDGSQGDLVAELLVQVLAGRTTG